MRILHTSDWHLGRTFHGVELLADQERILTELAELVAAESVDVVVLAGDVYDRSIPSADAIAVCQRVLAAIAAAGAQIVAISGNHDSPTRLGAGSRFSAAGGLFLRTTVAELDQPVLLADEHGPVAFYGIPYLEPENTRVELGVPEARSHAQILGAAMDRVRADIAKRPTTRTVLLAHAFVVGGVATPSERSIAVGGVESVPSDTFAGVDYVALGHLHSPQTLSDGVRYAGSPLPYSFGESSQQKSVWLVEFTAEGVGEVRQHKLPFVRELTQLTGTLDALLTSPDYAYAHEHYVSAMLTDFARPVDAMRQLRERFPHAVHVKWVGVEGDPALHYRERVRGRSDHEIAVSFLTDVRGEPNTKERRLLEDAVTAAQREDSA